MRYVDTLSCGLAIVILLVCMGLVLDGCIREPVADCAATAVAAVGLPTTKVIQWYKNPVFQVDERTTQYPNIEVGFRSDGTLAWRNIQPLVTK
jgi:hypothetical protein